MGLATIVDRGAFFGEVAMADPGLRSELVLAESKASLLVLTLDAIEQLYVEFPEAKVVVILQNIARVLVNRLRKANAQYAHYTSS